MNQDLTQKIAAELLNLENAVLTPAQVSDISKVPQALVNWETAHREYKDAGGTPLTASRQVGAMMRLLPTEVHDKAIWDFETYKDSPGKLRQWLKEKAKLFTQGSFHNRRRGVNLLEGEQSGDTNGEELNALGELDDEQVLAFVRRRWPNKGPGEIEQLQNGAKHHPLVMLKTPGARTAAPKGTRAASAPSRSGT